MALYPLTSYEYRYRITGSAWTSWVNCTTINSKIEGNRVIVYVPNENIAISDFQVRVRQLGINPPGEILSNSVAWAETYPTDFDYYLSDSDGEDSNDGLTPETPKKSFGSLSSLLSFRNTVGLKGGDVFFDQLSCPDSGGIGVYNGSQTIIDNTIDCSTGWTQVSGSSVLWQQTFTLGTSGAQYDNNYIIEVDKDIELTQPFTCRNYMPLTQQNYAWLETNPGTQKVLGPGYPMTIVIHPSNSQNPNTNPDYKYIRVFNPIAIDVGNGGKISKVIAKDAVNGYGPLAGSGTAKRIVVQGGSTHMGVMGQTNIGYAAFLNSQLYGIEVEVAFVFYKANVEGFVSKMKNTRFFDNKSSILSHNSSGGNAESITLEKVHHFQKPEIPNNVFADFSSVDNVYVNEIYTESAWGYKGTTEVAHITNSLFPKCYKYGLSFITYGGVSGGTMNVNNSLVLCRIDDIDPLDQISPFVHRNNTIHNIQHTIVTASSVFRGSRIFSHNVRGLEKNVIKYNIIIGDCIGGNTLNECFLVESAPDVTVKGESLNLTADYNIYIKLKGSSSWILRNVIGGTRTTLEDWQEWTGQDLNSLYFDISSAPEGLKKIFVDPDNGDWTFTNDPIALQIQLLSAGMITPPTSYPARPTFELAASDALNGVALPNLF